MGLELGEWIGIAILALILFGPNKLPEIAKSLGTSVKEFRRAASGHEEEPKRRARKKR